MGIFGVVLLGAASTQITRQEFDRLAAQVKALEDRQKANAAHIKLLSKKMRNLSTRGKNGQIVSSKLADPAEPLAGNELVA